MLKNAYVYRTKIKIDTLDPSENSKIIAANNLVNKGLLKEGNPIDILNPRILERNFTLTKKGKNIIEKKLFTIESSISEIISI